LPEIVKATELLKETGFKICYHLMPNLPGATLPTDQKMFKTLFSDERFQPDMIKIYPCVVTKGSLLYRWFKRGQYKTYTDKQLINLLLKIKKNIPEYVRINRLYRDIPAASIVSGCKISNLRQVLADKVKCSCIRCREVGLQQLTANSRQSAVNGQQSATRLKLKIIKYPASGGEEYFLQFVDQRNYLYAFLRLRLNARSTWSFLPEIDQAALIRELHTYGQLTPLAQSGSVQHTGLGKKLLLAAEKITRQNGYQKMAVISGVGAREYYKKSGYHLVGSYMVKNLAN
jgi:elongator complex protein 3